MGINGRAMGTDLVKPNKWCDCQRKEINCLKDQEDKWRGEIVGVNDDLRLFEARLDRAEEKRCRYGQTPSNVESLVSRKRLAQSSPMPTKTRRTNM